MRKLAIKTKLASLIVYLRCIRTDKNGKDIDEAISSYSKIIDALTNDIKLSLSTSEKTTKQKANWVNDDDITTLNKNLLSLIPKDIRTAKDLMHLRGGLAPGRKWRTPGRYFASEPSTTLYKSPTTMY